jgi:hypothetical protein
MHSNATKSKQIYLLKKANVFPMREMEEHAFDLSKEAVKL